MKQLLIPIVASLILSACNSTQPVAISPHLYLHDDAFPDHTLFAVESEEQVFGLNDEAKRFITESINPIADPVDRMETLVEKIFDRSDFNLLYMGNANTTATETFLNRAANCLSLSIMTYALAKEAGFNVRFQDIQIPEYWTRRDGFSLLNGHINLRILPGNEPHVIHLFTSGLEVDFDPQPIRNHFPRQLVSRKTVLAMFYNNKGADALIEGSYSKAYAYFREAIKTAPEFSSSWVNLGFLYRLNDQYQYAEESYDQALALKPDNLTAIENLALLYSMTGREKMAEAMLAKVERERDDNPYYHFLLGEQAFDHEQWRQAIEHYRAALRLDRGKHEVYYGLAKSYFHLGDVAKAKTYFERAKTHSHNYQDQQRYQGKLDLLSRI